LPHIERQTPFISFGGYMKITLDLNTPKTLARIERLRGKKTPGQFLRDCLQVGLAYFEQEQARQVQQLQVKRSKMH
jgi:hypothetical protein